MRPLICLSDGKLSGRICRSKIPALFTRAVTRPNRWSTVSKKLDDILLGNNISGNGDRRQPYLGDPAYDIVCSGWVMPIINTNGIPFFGS